jgi:tRNA threonylcarbamoyladenosine biosynthesis protein TsaB
VAICEPNALQIFPNAVLVDPPTAADALQFAAPLLLARDFADIATLDANYVRRSDAEIFAKAAGKP